MSAWTTALLTDIFRDILHSVPENAGVFFERTTTASCHILPIHLSLKFTDYPTVAHSQSDTLRG